jgi:hypothetical protein
MAAVLLIFAIISGAARLRGYKSPVYGAAGVVLYFIIDIPVSVWIQEVEANFSSRWSSYLACKAISVGLAVIAVCLFIYLLPGKDVRRGPAPTPVPYLGCGILATVLSLGCWLMSALMLLYPSQDHEAQPACTFFGILLFGTSVYCYRYHRQGMAASARRVLAVDSRAPILFLRSFQEDQHVVKKGSWLASWLPWHADAYSRKVGQTFEEWLAQELRALGPFIALGDPNDHLPTLGAARVYAADATWQSTVAEFVGRAQLILVVEGVTPGLKWELNHVRTTSSPARVAIFIPPPAFRHTDWPPFADLLNTAGIAAPAEDPGPGTIVGFDASFKAVIRCTGATEPRHYTSVLALMIQGTTERADAASLTVLEAPLDVCISYPDAGSRHKCFFRNSAALLRTLTEWKQQGREDIWLTWGKTPDALIGDMEELIRQAGASYFVPTGKRSRR